MNSDYEQGPILQRSNAFKSRVAIVLCLLAALFSSTFAGCAHRQRDPFAPKKGLAEKLAEKREARRPKEAVERIQAQTELVLQLDGHIRAMRFASNSKRLLIERSLAGDDYLFDYPEAFASVGALAEETPNSVGCELWNVEFSDARLEQFSPEKIGLMSSTYGSAAFDASGERLFWIDRAPVFTAKTQNASAVMRGAAPDDYGVLFRSSRNKVDEEEVELPSALFGADTADFASYVPTSAPESARNAIALGASQVLTKPLTSRTIAVTEEFEVVDETVKHMRVADETKNAECVWISPESQWLICRAGVSGHFDALEPSQELNAEVDPQWTLVLLRERRRVVHFPHALKMNFDSATSDEKIEGKIADVLAVSDKGDLVATLVEEITPEEAEFSFGAGKAYTKTDPRYKIVIWDLNVPKTVDFDKAKKPLMALEVAQISVAAPIPRKYCKFSPSGEFFAARTEPRYITVWQSGNGKLCNELGEHNGVVCDFAFAPQSAKMIVGVKARDHAQVVLWEIRQGVVHRTLDDLLSASSSIDAVAFAPDERKAYFANDLGEVKRWDIHAR